MNWGGGSGGTTQKKLRHSNRKTSITLDKRATRFWTMCVRVSPFLFLSFPFSLPLFHQCPFSLSLPSLPTLDYPLPFLFPQHQTPLSFCFPDSDTPSLFSLFSLYLQTFDKFISYFLWICNASYTFTDNFLLEKLYLIQKIFLVSISFPVYLPIYSLHFSPLTLTLLSFSISPLSFHLIHPLSPSLLPAIVFLCPLHNAPKTCRWNWYHLSVRKERMHRQSGRSFFSPS